jgi:hypothetical protein
MSPVQEFVHAGPRWTPRARLVIGRVTVGPELRASSIRAAIRGVRHRLRRCYERSPSFDRGAHHRIRVTLADHPTHRVAITIRNRDGAGMDVLTCMQAVLERADWPPLSADARVDVRLALSAQ